MKKGEKLSGPFVPVPHWFWTARLEMRLTTAQVDLLLAFFRLSYGFQREWCEPIMEELEAFSGLSSRTIRNVRHQLHVLSLVSFQNGRGRIRYTLPPFGEGPEWLNNVPEIGFNVRRQVRKTQVDDHKNAESGHDNVLPGVYKTQVDDHKNDELDRSFYKRKKRKESTGNPPSSDSRVSRLMNLLFTLHKDLYGEKPSVGGRDAKTIAKMLETHSEEEIGLAGNRLVALSRKAKESGFWKKPITAPVLQRWWNDIATAAAPTGEERVRPPSRHGDFRNSMEKKR